MFEAIIIDDEYFFRKSLVSTFPWEDFDIRIIADCNNSTEALELLKEHTPDIALVDINMPDMNGLTFIKNAKLLSPSTNYLIISGHDDFCYAQEAISLGVYKYLLKPVRHEELKAALNGLLSQLAQKKEQQNKLAYLYSQHNNYLDALRQQFLYNLINFKGKQYIKSLEEKCKFLELSWAQKSFYYIVCIGTEDQCLNYIAENSSLDFHDIITILQNEIVLPYDGVSCKSDDNLIFMLFASDEQISSEILISELKKIQLMIYNYTKLNFHFGISKPVTDLLQAAHAASQAHEALLQYRFGKTNLIRFVDNDEVKTFTLSQKIIQFSTYLYAGETDKTYHYLKNLEIELLNNDLGASSLLSIQLDYIRCFLNLSLEHHFETLTTLLLHEMHKSSESITVQTLIQNLFTWSNFVLQEFGKKISTKHSLIVENAISYIQQNFSDPALSVSSISEHLHLNYAYLCSIFKRDTNNTINQYIKQYRLIKSQELMRTGFDNISEIAIAVGFQNANYFSKCFKKEYGISPSDYLIAKND